MTTEDSENVPPDTDVTIDELARSAGAALRRAAPEDSIRRVVQVGRRRRRRQLGGAAVAGAIVFGGAVFVVAGDGDRPSVTADSTPTATTEPSLTTRPAPPASDSAPLPPTTSDPSDLAVVPPVTVSDAELVGSVERPAQMVTDGNTVWVLSDEGGASGFDAETGDMIAVADIVNHQRATQPVMAFGSLWIATLASVSEPGAGNQILRLDPRTGVIQAEIDLPPFLAGTFPHPMVLSESPSGLWAFYNDSIAGTYFTNVDPVTNSVSPPLIVDAPTATAGVYLAGSLWVLTAERGILRFDPEDGNLTGTMSRPEAGLAWSLREGGGSLWTHAITDDGRDAFVRIDPVSATVVSTIVTPDSADDYQSWTGDIVYLDGSIWANSAGAALVRIDPSTDSIVARFVEASGGGAIAATADAVWFSDYAAGSVYRLVLG